MTTNLRTIREIKDLRGKRVLLRVDANVPFAHGEIADDARLWAILPTINYLSARGAVTVIVSHLGRPDGRRDKQFSLAPVAKRLAQVSGKIITFLPQPFASKEIPEAIFAAVPGQIFMLENLLLIQPTLIMY